MIGEEGCGVCVGLVIHVFWPAGRNSSSEERRFERVTVNYYNSPKNF